MDQLTVKEKTGANYMLIELTGEMTSYTITELQEKVYDYIESTNVVLDMENVTQMDSSGVGLIFAGHNDGEEYKTKLFIMNPSDASRHALDRTGFIDFLHVIHSVTEVSNG